MPHQFQHYQTEDFLSCPKFRQWVFEPSIALDKFWSSFLALYPEKEPDLNTAKHILLKLHQQRQVPEETMMEEDWQIIKSTLLEDNKNSSTSYFYRYPWAVAASISLIVGLSFIVFFFQSSKVIHATSYGETKKVELPDGSKVVVNANSKISYAADWDTRAGSREVWLEGEAWFEVEEVYTKVSEQHKPEKLKFIVYTPELQVEVVGTAFNINSRSTKTQVTLSSGKVIVQGKQDQRIEMVPGEQLELSHVNNRLEKRVVDTETIVSWKDNKLIFENMPLAQVLEVLHERYGWEISVDPEEIRNYQYTGSAPADQPELLLDKISTLYQLEIERSEEGVTISKLPEKIN
ncbi:FecR domain-containing protein [Catalinimonas sp. 4WD22]|uniref:FecR family protein n=1 Tax=Catalinimonas locisalis TaxID=3133978 RepID=UPI003100E26D